MKNSFEPVFLNNASTIAAFYMQPFAAYTDYQYIKNACSLLQPCKNLKMQPFAALFYKS